MPPDPGEPPVLVAPPVPVEPPEDEPPLPPAPVLVWPPVPPAAISAGAGAREQHGQAKSHNEPVSERASHKRTLTWGRRRAFSRIGADSRGVDRWRSRRIIPETAGSGQASERATNKSRFDEHVTVCVSAKGSATACSGLAPTRQWS